ncbi:helix-turn-helix domain-containing protein [Urbifossiella limnaea]|uniref:Uncharacterized protein n=1 Tax=Urbifossiella limnaea TaxID=2528023 RepID=A0A517XPQ4_9BACT|nr:helix-turn-helix domain-containing protein [Urbifossiella limnaea]QDU19487.1 hypothetical protein ETAA1_14140 [Urbifossiella limnaea]
MQEIESSAALDARDAYIVAGTVAGKTPTVIAAELGVSVHTIYRRLKAAPVRQALTEARAAEVRPLVAQAVGEVQKSVERLVAVRDGETTRDGDRIRASVAILDWFSRVWEMGEVLPRIAALEAQLAASALIIETTNQHTSCNIDAVPEGMVADDC